MEKQKIKFLKNTSAKEKCVADSNCIFCRLDPKKDFILEKTANFYVALDAAPLSIGHLLLIPKKHISCYGALPAALTKEFNVLNKKILNFLERHYAKTIIFEHGIAGQTVLHAHLHFLPTRISIVPFIEKERAMLPIKKFLFLKNEYKKRGAYLFLQEDGKKYLIATKNTPPGYFHTQLLPKILKVPKEFKKRNKNADLFFNKVKKLWQKNIVN